MYSKWIKVDSLVSSGLWFRLALCVVSVTVAGWVEFYRPDFTVRLDEAVRDAFIQMSADDSDEERLSVVDIDEAALDELGAWPWSRGAIADLCEVLLGPLGARAVALDIVFPSPGADVVGDARLAALAEHAPLVLSQAFHYDARDDQLALGVLSGGRAVEKNDGWPVGLGYIANHDGLSGAACTGNIGYYPDEDGVLRRVPMISFHQGRVYPHLSFSLLSCFPPSVNSPANQVALRMRSKYPDGYWRVPFRREFSAYTVVSAADVLRDRVSADLFRGRYVVVGSSALGAGDRANTPLSPVTAGVMVHAEGISSLLDLFEGKLVYPWRGQWFVFAWSCICVLVLMVAVLHQSALVALAVWLLLALLWVPLAFLAVFNQMEGGLVAPLFSLFLLLLLGIPYEWWRSQRRVRYVNDMLSHYVDKPVLVEILKRPSIYSLEPSLRDVTVLIADMQGYTELTSSLSLEDAALLTKEFLDCLTRPVLARGGTLDKYTGDGLVAFWGAPLPCSDQADCAVSAALDILYEVKCWNDQRSNEVSGGRRVKVRLGVESGPALVGDLGTPFRSTYTAVGDCINFASRLETMAGDLQTPLVIGPVATSLLMEHQPVSLGKHILRGTTKEIELYTLSSCCQEKKGDLPFVDRQGG